MVRALPAVLRGNVDIGALSIPVSRSWWKVYVCRSDLPNTLPVAQSLVRSRAWQDCP